jgi:hypothetical protein
VAHGDLQHGNILVRSGSIQLVDYDGMWVPALRGRHATETGHRAYQHPERSGQDYGQEIDRFSALVIYLSLAALERDATLWERFHTGDNLIFVQKDFQQAGRSAIWQQLSRIGSREIDRLTAAVVGTPLLARDLRATTGQGHRRPRDYRWTSPSFWPLASRTRPPTCIFRRACRR